VCRTPWRHRIVCATCIDRILGAGEATSEQARNHARQATLAVVFGGLAWLLTLLVFGGMALAGPGNKGALVALVLLLFLVLLIGIPAAAFGVGQAVAALRVRGNHMILGTIGLVLSGLYVGVLLGLSLFSLWQS
jgi:hypothetical protein